MEDLILERLGADEAVARLDALAETYAEIYGTLLSDPFRSVTRYRQRVTGYTTLPGFALMMAHAGGEVAGYALGYTLTPHARWWTRVVPPLPDEFAHEPPGGRTFVLEELMVRPRWRSQGVAHALYRAILDDRHEERATLLIGISNGRAHSQARHWGWRCVGQQRPEPDAPEFDTMVRDLPLA